MRKGNIIVVEACSGGINYIADIIKRNYQPVILEIDTGDEPEMTAIVKAMHEEVYQRLPEKVSVICEKKDYRETLQMVRELKPDLILPGMEGGVELAFRLSEDLGLRGNPCANMAQYTRKDAMHRALQENGLRAIRGRMVKTAAELRAFAEEIGTENLVVKPARSASSMDVRLCSNVEEACEGLEVILRDDRFANSQNNALVQERIFGKEMVVNTVSRDGRHALLSLYKYEKVPTEKGLNLYQCEASVMNFTPEISVLVGYAFQTLDALGFQNGIVHGEYMVDEKGPVLMEVNCRPMGPALSPDFQDRAFGQHETDSALDAMLSEEKFLALCQRSYATENQIMNYYIPVKKDMLIWNIPLKAQLKKLKTYYLDTLPEAGNLPKAFDQTVDFETMMGIVCLCGSEADVRRDHDWIENELAVHYEECVVYNKKNQSSAIYLPETEKGRHLMQSMDKMMRITQKAVFEAGNIEAVIQEFGSVEDTEWPFDVMTGAPLQVDSEFSKKVIADTDIYILQSDEEPEVVILYLSGGAFLYPIGTDQLILCDMLAHKTRAKVVVPLYRRIPQHHCTEALDMLTAVYTEILKENKRVIFAGDSSGGGLALGFVYHCHSLNLPLPAGLILISPWLDVTLADPELRKLEHQDMILAIDGLRVCGRIWADALDEKDPRVSPLFGDGKELPEMLLFAGTNELILSDIQTLYERLKDHSNVTLVIGEGMLHDFPLLAPDTEQGLEAREMMVKFIKKVK